jgi:hypothetical protein
MKKLILTSESIKVIDAPEHKDHSDSLAEGWFKEQYQAKLEKAIKEGIIIKESDYSQHTFLNNFEQGKLYDIPPYYKVHIKECDCKDCAGPNCQYPFGYAILLPVQAEICPKCRSTDFANCHSMRCPMREGHDAGDDYPIVKQELNKKQIMAEKFWDNIEKSYAHIKQPTSIEEAADEFASDGKHELYELRKQSFIAGAKWMEEQLKQLES